MTNVQKRLTGDPNGDLHPADAKLVCTHLSMGRPIPPTRRPADPPTRWAA
ncbi:hypothetical protein PQR34_29975 [Paraburkholderia sediminicola]